MKNKILFVGIALFIGAVVSCKKEGCTNSLATNYNADAKKDDGTCVYPPIDDRDQYLGNYIVTDSLFLFGSYSETVIYTLIISREYTVKDTIYLHNLWNDGATYLAIMTGSSFSIPSQQVSGPYYVTGSGDLANHAITYQTSGDVYLNKGTGPKQE